MADNVAITPGSGATVATDDVGGVQYQRVKLDLGGDGLSSPLLRGQQTKANSLPVTLASDQGALSITASSLPLPTGAATAAKQPAPGIAGTPSSDVLTVQGAVSMTALKVDGSAVTQPVSGSVSVSGTVTASNVSGNAAHDAVDSGNPVKVGARARSADIAAVAADDRTDLVADLTGKLIVNPYAVPESSLAGATAAITSTSDTAVIAAQGAGMRIYVTELLVTNAHGSVGTVVEIKDGATVIHRGFAAANGGGFALAFPKPLRLTGNTALNAANVTTGSSTYVSASGFKAA